MPYLKQNEDNYVELKALALSIVIFADTLNLVIILFSRKSMTTLSVANLVGIDSTHCNVPKPIFLLGTLTAQCLFVFGYVFAGFLMELPIRVYIMMIIAMK
jgi:fucose 4-O-acetylase-like acetyltransferase